MSLEYPLPERPRLRHLNVIPIEADGKRLLILQDPQNYTEPLIVSEALGLFLMLCDGRHTPKAMQETLNQEFGLTLPLSQVRLVLEKMDNWLLFDSLRLAAHVRRIDEEFMTGTVRPGVHAGSSYPAEPDALRERLDEILASASANSASAPGNLVGLIAPHIDLRVGGRAYAPAYQALKHSLAKTNGDASQMTFVILGTSHYGGQGLFIASRKDFETPLGRISCDRELLDRLEANLGTSISANDTAHRHEHSIEFQIIFLQHLFGERIARGEIHMVPILCTSFHALLNGHTPNRPPQADEYQKFVAALRKTLNEHQTPTCLIVGGDLAHVGRKFGDPFDAEAVLERVAKEDAELLDVVRNGNSQGLLAHIARDQDGRNVCGFPPMLAFLDALDVYGSCRGELLHYEQWDERETASAVTYASLAFWKS